MEKEPHWAKGEGGLGGGAVERDQLREHWEEDERRREKVRVVGHGGLSSYLLWEQQHSRWIHQPTKTVLYSGINYPMSLNLDFHKGIHHGVRPDWAAHEGPQEQGPGINWKELPTVLTRSVNWITVQSSEPQTDILWKSISCINHWVQRYKGKRQCSWHDLLKFCRISKIIREIRVEDTQREWTMRDTGHQG